MPPATALLALDWGTTALRAYRMGADGAVLERRALPLGVMQVADGDFAGAFEQATGDWRAREPDVPVLAAGMVGSTQGWVQVPYLPCPAGVAELAAALAPVHGGRLHVVPGLARHGDRPDVMRGEETQVVGALAAHPALAPRARLVLPGTHAKWVHVADGRVRDFATYLTGELFAVLRDHSILGRPARDAAHDSSSDSSSETSRETSRDADAAADDAFDRGVRAARDGAGGVAPLLFSARALVLAGRLDPDVSLQYLSGLLIGDEVRCALADAGDADAPLALVGEPALCRRYAAALRHFGVEHAPIVEDAAPRGLWAIAARAGLAAAAREAPVA